jgi:hypothetical protein
LARAEIAPQLGVRPLTLAQILPERTKEMKNVSLASQFPTPDHWVQGMMCFRRPNGVIARCLREAIWDLPLDYEPHIILRQQVEEAIGWEELIRWNDNPKRTFTDILALCATVDSLP